MAKKGSVLVPVPHTEKKKRHVPGTYIRAEEYVLKPKGPRLKVNFAKDRVDKRVFYCILPFVQPPAGLDRDVRLPAPFDQAVERRARPLQHGGVGDVEPVAGCGEELAGLQSFQLSFFGERHVAPTLRRRGGRLDGQESGTNGCKPVLTYARRFERRKEEKANKAARRHYRSQRLA